MSTINGSTLRLTGMASGLDTESIVSDLMKVEKYKVDEVKKQKSLLEWKQEYYQEITTKLSAFQSKYFGTSSSSSLIGGSLNALTATCNSPYVSITAGSNTTEGSMYIADILSLASGAKITSNQAVTAAPKISVNSEALGDLSGKSIVVTLDGVSKTLTFSPRIYSTAADVQDELNAQLGAAFGAGRVNVMLNGSTLSMDSQNSALRISVPTDTESNPTGILDFDSYAGNRLELNMTLAQSSFANDIFAAPDDQNLNFTINGTPFSFSGERTVNDVIKAVNASAAGVTMSYSSLTDSFSLTSKTTGAASSISVQDDHGFLMDALLGTGAYTAGTDAVVRMSANGSTNEEDLVTVQRSTNSFSVNGAAVKLLGKASGDAQEGINVSFSYNSDSIVENVKAFVDDYNELLGSITTLTSAERFRDYKPLSDDEKDEMSDKEIELWTEKAKSGILRGDTTLQSIETELKSSMFSAIQKLGESGSNLGILADIGITTSGYQEKGKLHLDENKLREALTSDTEKTLGLLTQTSSTSYSQYASSEQRAKRFNESGALWRLSDILTQNLNTVGKKGMLITLVGSPNSAYLGESEYRSRIADIQDRIDSMNEKLISQEDTYYKRFSAMETALSKLNSQSSWLANMLGQGQQQ
jgi:flagellar hook-associated protein 2